MNRKPFRSVSFSISLIPLLLLVAAPRLSAQNIKVTSADPPSAPQGTVSLNVTIGGSGFKTGAQASFFVTGTRDPGGIRVNQTTFISSTELVANIDVADAAVVARFD